MTTSRRLPIEDRIIAIIDYAYALYTGYREEEVIVNLLKVLDGLGECESLEELRESSNKEVRRSARSLWDALLKGKYRYASDFHVSEAKHSYYLSNMSQTLPENTFFQGVINLDLGSILTERKIWSAAIAEKRGIKIRGGADYKRHKKYCEDIGPQPIGTMYSPEAVSIEEKPHNAASWAISSVDYTLLGYPILFGCTNQILKREVIKGEPKFGRSADEDESEHRIADFISLNIEDDEVTHLYVPANKVIFTLKKLTEKGLGHIEVCSYQKIEANPS